MTTTRWKLTAGGLVLALGGLAAVAGVPASSCQPDHKAGPAVLVEVPVAPVAYQAPAAPAVPTTPEPTPLPAVSTPAELPSLPPPVVTAEKKSEPKPAPKENKVFELAVPVEEVKPAAATPPSLPSPETKSAPTLPLPVTETPEPLLPSPEPSRPTPPPVRPDPAPTPVRPTPASADPLLNAPPTDAPPAVEKKLKVMLHMGDDRPRFEVRDGDEVYLKVVCDKVDVKSPSDRGETMSTLRATGRVTFVTPGGEGTCEELTVIPGTGQVVVAGRVSFKYNWGKVETTVSGDKMTFRLGSTLGVAPTTVQATHRTR